MRKISIIGTVIVCAVMMCGRCMAAGETYNFGLFMGTKDAQMKTIFTEAVKYIGKQQNITINMKWFVDENEFMKAAEKHQFDYAYSKKADSAIKMITTYGYEPFLSTSLYGKNDQATCFFSNAKVKVANLQGMKGLKFATYAARDGYYPLRQLFKVEPEAYFSQVVLARDGLKLIDMVAKGEVDVALVYDLNADSMKVFNPGLAKSINKLTCTELHPAPPMVRMKNAPPALTDAISDIMKNVKTVEVMKPYRNLIKATKIGFYTVTKADYAGIIKYYADAEKKGWAKDYDKWMAKNIKSVIE